MAVEAGAAYFKNFREPIQRPDPNRIPNYIKPETVQIKDMGSEKVIVIGGPMGIDINI